MKKKKIRILHNRQVRRTKYTSANHDDYLSKLVAQVRDKILVDQDSDFLLLMVGVPGSGKSMLSLHAYESFDPGGCDIKYISFDREGFANSISDTSKKPNLRFVCNDEANVSKRDSMSQYNKDMIDLYFSIRGLNIFHIWNNPSADMIDKAFLQERVRGLILIYDLSPNKRTYHYFKSREVLKIYDKNGNLKLATLKRNRRLAYYKGWFRPYSGKLWSAYKVKKDGRMVDKVKSFREKWGSNDRIKRAQLAKEIGRCVESVKGYENRLVKAGLLIEGKNFFRDGKGHISYLRDTLPLFMKEVGIRV